MKGGHARLRSGDLGFVGAFVHSLRSGIRSFIGPGVSCLVCLVIGGRQENTAAVGIWMDSQASSECEGRVTYWLIVRCDAAALDDMNDGMVCMCHSFFHAFFYKVEAKFEDWMRISFFVSVLYRHTLHKIDRQVG